MSQKILACFLMTLLVLCVLSPALADDGSGVTYYYNTPVLDLLEHNCPNTGIMLPEEFDPYTNTYLLTVASWVSKVCFTPVCSDSGTTIYVNNEIVRSGKTSSYTKMTDNPQTVEIRLINAAGYCNTYTIYLQRRPSDKRTRVSAGYINSITSKKDVWYIDADLVTVTYSDGNLSTFTNSTVEINKYKYACTDSCIFYYGTMNNPTRAYDIYDFISNYQYYGSDLYRFVYIEDEIVAVMPYEADY